MARTKTLKQAEKEAAEHQSTAIMAEALQEAGLLSDEQVLALANQQAGQEIHKGGDILAIMELADSKAKNPGIRISHVFAANRKVLLEEFGVKLVDEVVAPFNAALEDVRRERDTIIEKYG